MPLPMINILPAGRRARGGAAPAVVGARGDPVCGSWCRVTSLPSPSGDVVVLQICGEIDLSTIALVETAVHSVMSQRPAHLTVDLAGVTFCCARGLAVLLESGATAAAQGTGYAVSAVSPQANRMWALLWSAERLPTQYPSAQAAALAAMAVVTAAAGLVPTTDHRLAEQAT